MIDTHSHLFVEEFVEDLSEVILRAQHAGVSHIFMPNIDDTTVDNMLAVCGAYPGYCFPMIGFHPTSVDANAMDKVKRMKEYLVDNHPFIAVGEVGIDLYWDKTYCLEQQRIFDEQIQWAMEWNLPLVIHCREAFDELLEVMAPYKNTDLSGIFHSFTGTCEDVLRVLDYRNFMIGINGVVTFKKSTLPEVLQNVPLSRIVVETDSPYLAPAPFRGKRNESSYIIKVVEKLAEVYSLRVDEISQITSKNALKVFKRVG